MRNSKTKLLFIFTLLLGIFTSFLIYRFLNGVNQAVAVQNMTNVVVASQRIVPGTLLTPELVKTIQVPAQYAPAQSVNAPEQVINQFANVDLWPEEAILASQVVNQNTSSELPYKIPKGSRAITIAVSGTSGIAGHIKPGHYVDILTFQESRVYTLMQKVLVLAVGADLQKKDGAQAADTVTLAVYPEETQIITLAENIGRFKLVLRPPDEAAKPAIRSVNPQILKAKYP